MLQRGLICARLIHWCAKTWAKRGTLLLTWLNASRGLAIIGPALRQWGDRQLSYIDAVTLTPFAILVVSKDLTI
jgi:hypothetical protein